MTILFRAMKRDSDDPNCPMCGPTARTLGVRLFGDIPVTDGMVAPETGGMSVAPERVEHLEEHRRPRECGGTGKDPAWKMDSDDLPTGLVYRPDPDDPSRHGFVEPIEAMSLDDYQELLGSSRGTWEQA